MTDREAADKGIEALYGFIKEIKMPLTLKELGATKDMLPKIANSTVLGGGYKQMNAEDILKVLEACYE